MPGHYDVPVPFAPTQAGAQGAFANQSGMTELLSLFQQQQPTGLLGLLGGPAGGPLGMGAGALLSAFGSLVAGDGGKKKRLREAQRQFQQLANSQVDEGRLRQGSQLFGRAVQPKLNDLFSQAAGRVGLDSGIGQGAALGSFGDLLAQFESQNFQNESNRVAQDRRFGAQGLASIVNI